MTFHVVRRAPGSFPGGSRLLLALLLILRQAGHIAKVFPLEDSSTGKESDLVEHTFKVTPAEHL